MNRRFVLVALSILFTFMVAACASSRVSPSDKIPVVATTSILADVIGRVGGDLVSVTTLVPAGANEHEYQPSPRDITAVSDAALVFEVGLGLEEFMSRIIENAAGEVNVITVSQGITAIDFFVENDHEEDPEAAQGENHAGDQHGSTVDPHVWLDPANVIIWTKNIAAALSEFDPIHSETYKTNSETYITELHELDAWITAEVARIPQGQRLIVTDHMLFGYFAEKYGFTVIGAIIPSYSSMAQPSAQELAALEDAIHQYNVKVILVGNTVNPAMAGRIAGDTGTALVQFFTGSLSASDGPAATYQDYMRYNVSVIVNALAGE